MEIELDVHPTAIQLQAFAEGRLEQQTTDIVGEHVAACNQCADLVDQLDVDAEAILFSRPVKSHLTQASTEALSEVISLTERLQIEEAIGSGGMGVVYRAWQPSVNRHVAVKLLHVPLPQLERGADQARERFEREIEALGRVRHAHVARIYSSGLTADGRLFYSMELIEGTNLSAVLGELVSHDKRPARPISWLAAVAAACGRGNTAEAEHAELGADYVEPVCKIVRQIATAVQTLHDAGILHRDIKPGNIMVNACGDHATLMDLGLAGLIDAPDVRLTGSGLVAGSLPYISPEQFRGAPPTRSGDIYNLGAVLWELLTRQRLFYGAKHTSNAQLIHRILHEDASAMRHQQAEVPPGLEAIALRCLEKEPTNRYDSVAEFIADLDRWTEGQPVTAKRRNWLGKLRGSLRRNRRLVTISGIFLMCQALLLAVIYRSQGIPLGTQHQASIAKTDFKTPLSALPQSSAVINDGSLVAYWSAEETGSFAPDRSPNGNNGALIGDTSRQPGAVGQAYVFDGNGDYINFGRASKWNFLHDGSEFSVTGFIAPTDPSRGGGVLTTIDETSTAELRHGFSLRLNKWRMLEFHIQGVSGKFPVKTQSETALEPNVFTAFAITFDGHTCNLFINGKLEGSGQTVAPFVASTALDALCMGAIGTTSGPNGQPFYPLEGRIDEVQIYNRPLNASEVAFLAGRATLQDARIIRVAKSTAIAEGGLADGTSTTATHNDQGLGGPFPTFPTTHTSALADAFLTASSFSASVHYDFGSRRSVDQIRLWNFHGDRYGLEGNGRGAKSIRIFGSNLVAAYRDEEHDSWRLLTAFTAARAPADGATSHYGEEHSVDEHSIRFIRVQIDDNYGASNVGLAEIQFLDTR